MGPLARAKQWARALKQDVLALWIAARDPRTPWYAKLVAGAVAAYALGPVDLIPDFVPVLGYLDDLVIVPLGILLVVRLVPAPLMAEYRAAAAGRGRPVSRGGLVAIVVIWVAVAGIGLRWLRQRGAA
ncbi:YkvA family protein [Ancylobacter sp. 3268]|uniref:YkvA family protein n=1 Tax=Ancylobacter sp. 3268 TaxID=2817752 RepID=UPI00286B9ECA|nr:YkvA family protein [Ancylobacter sp. 3268]